MPGFSDYAENKVLDDITGKTSFTVTAPTFLALATTAPGETTTGANIVEANYGGYARASVAAATWNAAASGSTTTNATITFNAVASGSNVIAGWALLDSATLAAGNILMFGTTSATTVSTTQTPPTVAAGALTLTLD